MSEGFARNVPGRRSPPAAAENILEEGVDGVESAAPAASGKDEVASLSADDDLFGLQGGGAESGVGETDGAFADEEAV